MAAEGGDALCGTLDGPSFIGRRQCSLLLHNLSPVTAWRRTRWLFVSACGRQDLLENPQKEIILYHKEGARFKDHPSGITAFICSKQHEGEWHHLSSCYQEAFTRTEHEHGHVISENHKSVIPHHAQTSSH